MIDCGGCCFLLIVGGVGMFVSCFIMGVYFYVIFNLEYFFGIFDIFWVVVISVVVYIVGFVMLWGFCIWFFMSEFFLVKVCGIFSGIVMVFNWLCFFVVIKLFSI